MRIAIIGSGVIGLTIANQITKLSNKEVITIFSVPNCSKSASMAAGAMINIVSEVDAINIDHPLTHKKLLRKKELLMLWEKHAADFSSHQSNLIEGEGTEVRLLKSSENMLEHKSFNAICTASKKYHQKYKISDNVYYKSIFLPDEKSIDAHYYLSCLRESLSEKKDIIFQTAFIDFISKINKSWLIYDTNGRKYEFDFIILCAGSFSEKIINKTESVLLPNIRSFHGVGSALNLYKELPYTTLPSFTSIIRSPNRGGTCGIHFVQRKNSIYIGASSLVTPIPLKGSQSGSIKYLLENANKLFNIDLSKLSLDLLTGYRPITADACPIIGFLAKDFYCAYGTKRDGLTWSPYYSYNIAREILDLTTMKSWEEYRSYCHPSRSYNSAGSVKNCTNYYVLSKIYEAFQHNQKLNDNEISHLKNIADDVHKKYSPNKGIQPELINMYYYNHINHN